MNINKTSLACHALAGAGVFLLFMVLVTQFLCSKAFPCRDLGWEDAPMFIGLLLCSIGLGALVYVGRHLIQKRDVD